MQLWHDKPDVDKTAAVSWENTSGERWMKNERQESRQVDSVTNGLICHEKGSARATTATRALSVSIKESQAENEKLDFSFYSLCH